MIFPMDIPAMKMHLVTYLDKLAHDDEYAALSFGDAYAILRDFIDHIEAATKEDSNNG